ncbi:MAG: L-histidine N(alpha)-methyltransferase [Deltaproteobacteria bacterium]|nr:L-histidine N(alpha)-methyltransferase [Deltaproteobacteria bacterium]
MMQHAHPAPHAPALDAATAEVLDGLHAPRKRLPCKLLYDAAGAQLFERICELDEYYPTRHELALLEAHLPEIAARVGPRARVIEPGSGSGRKTQRLLAALARPAVYVPIDVSGEQLDETAAELRRAFPGLDVRPLCADYTSLDFAAGPHDEGRTLVFFPGSTIGNFEPDQARAFLARLGQLAGPRATLLLGADANTDPETLVPAYDDREGVTSAFDLNLLAHVNRRFAGTFDLAAFQHRAVWNAARSRVEMHLVSLRRQAVTVAGQRIDFARGEPIVTEHCYKHPPGALAALIAAAGWRVRETFADERGWMRLWLAER